MGRVNVPACCKVCAAFRTLLPNSRHCLQVQLEMDTLKQQPLKMNPLEAAGLQIKLEAASKSPPSTPLAPLPGTSVRALLQDIGLHVSLLCPSRARKTTITPSCQAAPPTAPSPPPEALSPSICTTSCSYPNSATSFITQHVSHPRCLCGGDVLLCQRRVDMTVGSCSLPCSYCALLQKHADGLQPPFAGVHPEV